MAIVSFEKGEQQENVLDKMVEYVGEACSNDEFEKLEAMMFDYTFVQALSEVLEEMGSTTEQFDKSLGGEEIQSKKEVMKEEVYRDALQGNIKQYIDEEIDLKEFYDSTSRCINREELETHIFDLGNIQSPLAESDKKQFVLNNLDTLSSISADENISNEDIGKMFLNEDWNGLEGVLFSNWLSDSIEEVVYEYKQSPSIEHNCSLKM